jgi:hypothetical protein
MRRVLKGLACGAMMNVMVLAAPGLAHADDQAGAGGAGSRDIGIRGFAAFDYQSFVASESFDAILDTDSGPLFGGGVEVTLPWNLFVQVSAARLRETGQRVFRANDRIFKLGIPTTITITPLDFTGGYRFRFWRMVPYAGAGGGSQAYRETSEFAEDDENVDERHGSFHILGGVDVPIWRWVGAAFEVQHRWVPDAIGEAGISQEFGEEDLGGTSVRLRVYVGFDR